MEAIVVTDGQSHVDTSHVTIISPLLLPLENLSFRLLALHAGTTIAAWDSEEFAFGTAAVVAGENIPQSTIANTSTIRSLPTTAHHDGFYCE